jgi:hypothetical protein
MTTSEMPPMREQPLFCPQCGNPLSRVSRRQDYFCRACHSVVAVIDDEFALLQSDVKNQETVITLESLHHPVGHHDEPRKGNT